VELVTDVPAMATVRILGESAEPVPGTDARLQLLHVSAPLEFSGCDWYRGPQHVGRPTLPPRRPSVSKTTVPLGTPVLKLSNLAFATDDVSRCGRHTTFYRNFCMTRT